MMVDDGMSKCLEDNFTFSSVFHVSSDFLYLQKLVLFLWSVYQVCAEYYSNVYVFLRPFVDLRYRFKWGRITLCLK